VDKTYVLDTSAIFTYTDSEPGADAVEHILNLAEKKKCRLFISFISLMEIYYIAWRERGEDSARELVVLIKSLSLEIVESCERITLSAGRIKANYKLSLADALIAATALDKGAVLVHKDPELAAVSGLIIAQPLPFKRGR